MDLFDMQNDFAVYKETAFATCAHEFFKRYEAGIGLANFMTIPQWIWYPYIDIFFEKIMTNI